MERKSSSNPTESTERQPYETPRVVYREDLEAVATACTPAPPAKGSPGACTDGPISS
ncbi:MAG: hypothetical protein WCE62_21905 [Polyangiales bacterium]